MQIKEISSPSNPYLKEIAAVRKAPTGERFFLEGTRFVEELPPECVLEIFTTDLEKHGEFLKTLPQSVPVFLLSPRAMGKICAAVSDQTIACTVTRRQPERPEKLMLLDRVQDPGNVGTIVRTAYAFGFGVILSPGCANPWSAKTLMSTAGAFRSCYIEQAQNLPETIRALRNDGFSVFATALDESAVSPDALTVPQKRAVIIGSEGQGVCAEALEAADRTVYIPMQNPINSLNAASAASIMLYLLK